MQDISCTVNAGKQLVVGSEQQYYCFVVKTKLVTQQDNLANVIQEYVKPLARKNDIVFVSEKMVACTQGRAIPLEQVTPGVWAKILCRFVTKNPGGIGLGIPQTMQCAINECGLPKILLAAFVGMLGKLLGTKGWFYRVAGVKAAAIDGPCHWTIPPYNQCVVLAPKNPDEVAKAISRQLGGINVLIVDLNDFGGRILGRAKPGDENEHILPLLLQNPLGQAEESTPIGILRPIYK